MCHIEVYEGWSFDYEFACTLIHSIIVTQSSEERITIIIITKFIYKALTKTRDYKALRRIKQNKHKKHMQTNFSNRGNKVKKIHLPKRNK